MLASLATFGIAFLARPIGSAVFGHFGDRIGRKTTLVAALLTMGLSTVAIGALPTYETIGIVAPALLALCRFGQGLGLGGEWGGAVLLATENAPPGKRAWYGMFPQLGAPLGFFFSGGIFIALSHFLTDEQFFTFGWRIPFLASAALVMVGLYVRLTITETPIFKKVLARQERVKVPMLVVLTAHPRLLVIGVLISLSVFVIFYLMIVFALSWGTAALGYTREQFLWIQLFGILFFALTIPWSATMAERGRRGTLIRVNLAIFTFGLVMAPMFEAGVLGAIAAMVVGMSLGDWSMDRSARFSQNSFRLLCGTQELHLLSTSQGYSAHRSRLTGLDDAIACWSVLRAGDAGQFTFLKPPPEYNRREFKRSYSSPVPDGRGIAPHP